MAKSFTEHELVASICRSSLFEFTKEWWSVISAETPSWNWHIEYLCDELQTMMERVFLGLPRLYDLVVNCPPGSTKSSVFSVMLPAWAWTRMPSFKFIGASYAASLAMELSRKTRDVVKSEKYQKCFPHVKLREDQDAKHHFINTANGMRYSVGVNGSVLGLHGSVVLVDDALDPEQSFSDAEVKIANRWMMHTLPQRKVDKAVSPMILVMQRLRSDDPSGDMLDNAKRPGAFPVKHIRIPADDSFEISPPELRGRYKNGLMDPVRLPRTVLDAERARNEYSYVSQYGQDPRPVGSRMFEEHYFTQREKAGPYQATRIRYWDRAATDALNNPNACFTAGVLMARGPDGKYYVEHVHHGQWEPSRRNKEMRAIAQRDRDKYGPYEPIIWVEREGGSAGRDAWMGVASALAGFVVREDMVSGKKEVRAEPLACQFAAGNVVLIQDGTWDVRGYVEELVAFPHCRLKDRTDASSGAFNLLTNVKKLQAMRILKIQDKPKVSVRFLVCEEQDLTAYREEEHALIVRVSDPLSGTPEFTSESVPNLVDLKTLEVYDVDRAARQDTWEEPVEPYGRLPVELLLTEDAAKRLWAFLLKNRPQNASAVLFVQRGSIRLALSLAEGVAAGLRLPGESVQKLNHEGTIPCEVNAHVRDVVKRARYASG